MSADEATRARLSDAQCDATLVAEYVEPLAGSLFAAARSRSRNVSVTKARVRGLYKFGAR